MKPIFYIHESSIVDKNVKIGKGSKIWHWCHISKNSKIGKDCVIGQNVFIGENVAIGDNVKIQNNVSLYDGVIIEDDVFLGPSCVFTNVLNPRAFINKKKKFEKTLVKRGSTIGANSTIICGLTIGSYSFIGAGSVVTKNVSNYRLVYGNPAKNKAWVSKNGDIIKKRTKKNK